MKKISKTVKAVLSLIALVVIIGSVSFLGDGSLFKGFFTLDKTQFGGPEYIGDIQVNVPTLKSPTDNQYLENGTAEGTKPYTWHFDWSDVPNASAYKIYAIGPQATQPLIDMTVTGQSEWTFEFKDGFISQDNQKGWKWKVRAQIDGKWQPWSNEKTFNILSTDQIDFNRLSGLPTEVPSTFAPATPDKPTVFEEVKPAAPAAPTPPAPKDTTNTSPAQPPEQISPAEFEQVGNVNYFQDGLNRYKNNAEWTFEWSPVPGAERYEIAVYDNKGTKHLNNILLGEQNTKSVFTIKDQISDSNLYFWEWKVRAKKDNEWSQWTSTAFDVTPAKPLEESAYCRKNVGDIFDVNTNKCIAAIFYEPVPIFPKSNEVMENPSLIPTGKTFWRFDWQPVYFADKYILEINPPENSGKAKTRVTISPSSKNVHPATTAFVEVTKEDVGTDLTGWNYTIYAQVGPRGTNWSTPVPFQVAQNAGPCRANNEVETFTGCKDISSISVPIVAPKDKSKVDYPRKASGDIEGNKIASWYFRWRSIKGVRDYELEIIPPLATSGVWQYKATDQSAGDVAEDIEAEIPVTEQEVMTGGVDTYWEWRIRANIPDGKGGTYTTDWSYGTFEIE